jgi:predicted DNA-binding protein (MmcQ/YjbR family)
MKPTTPAPPSVRRHEEALREHALAYPETHEEFPWGHRALKVKGKVFVFLYADGEGLSLSIKLPHSREAALEKPFAEPTHYGLGKSGWVTAQFAPSENPPLDLLRAWIDESYRAIAPKKLVAALTGGTALAKPAAKSAAKPGRGARKAPSAAGKKRGSSRA